MLDVENESKLSNIAKTEEGRVSFATKIVQDHFKQGFKGICFRTKDINQVKSTLENRGVDVIGPIDMEEKIKKVIKFVGDCYILLTLTIQSNHLSL